MQISSSSGPHLFCFFFIFYFQLLFPACFRFIAHNESIWNYWNLESPLPEYIIKNEYQKNEAEQDTRQVVLEEKKTG